MNKKEAVVALRKVSSDIKMTDDSIIKTTERLKIVLLNLKIEDARIRQNTSISPIVDELARSINNIESSVLALIDNDRNKLREIIETLEGEE